MDDEKLGELATDIKWIKNWMQNADKKYASKWTEKFVYLLGTGVVIWVLQRVLELIPTVQALTN